MTDAIHLLWRARETAVFMQANLKFALLLNHREADSRNSDQATHFWPQMLSETHFWVMLSCHVGNNQAETKTGGPAGANRPVCRASPPRVHVRARIVMEGCFT